jgi:PTS system fructose-specific IIC component
VIIASDATVSERNRFDGKPTVEVRLREAMDKPGEVIERAMRAAEKAGRRGSRRVGRRRRAGRGRRRGCADEHGRHRVGGRGPALAHDRGELHDPVRRGRGILIALAFALGGAVQVTETDVYEDFSVRP